MEEINARSFASDNNSGIIPEAVEALIQANQNHCAAYGNDSITEECKGEFKKAFGDQVRPYLVFNGTAANNLCLQALLKPYEATICAETAHLHHDECGAPERIVGTKLLLIPTKNGKIQPGQIKEKLIRLGDPHCVQPRVVSITQTTELGTLYTLEEMKAISEVCKENGLYFHIDGSRLVNAATRLNCSLKEITYDVGADAVSFGGTKNGLMLAESSLFFSKELSKGVPFYQKQLLQLPGKSRFVAAQYLAFFKNETWRKYSRHSLEMADLLAAEMAKVKGVEITQKTQSNAVFAKIPPGAVKPSKKKYFYYVWDEKTCEVRWMTTFDTTKDDVMGFVSEVQNSIANL